MPEYQPQIPDEDTVSLVLAEIPEADRGIFLLRAFMGFRPSEARRLNVADLKRGKRADLQDAFVALPPRSSKKRKGRNLQLHPEVAAWLVKHGNLKRFGAAPLFVNSRAHEEEQRWTTWTERGVLARAYDAAGVDWIKPNELCRHAFATEAINRGVDVYQLKEWMGHSDVSTTERYAKLRPQPIARMFGKRSKKRA